MTIIDKAEISITAQNNTKAWLDDVRDDIAWFKKRVKSESALELSLNVAKLKSEIQTAWKYIKEAQKLWDFNLEIKLRADQALLQQQLTQAGRELRNFTRTGEKDVSVLWKLFAWLWEKFEYWQERLKKLNSEMSSLWKSTAPIDNLIKKSETLNNSFKKWEINANQFKLWLKDIEKQTASLEKSIWKTESVFSKLWLNLNMLVTGGIIWWLTAIIQKSITLWSEAEKNQIKFETMLWSASEATKLIDQLNQFAKDTTFDTQNVKETATNLMAVWIEAKNIIPVMKSVWDVASMLWWPEIFWRLTYAFWQVKSAWKLTWNELRQFSETWVPLLWELAKNLWKTETEIKQMVETWKIGFKDVAKAFETMSSEGWKFANWNAKQTETVIWKWWKLKDEVMLALTEIWLALEPFTKFVIDSFSLLFTKLRQAFIWFRIVWNVVIAGLIQWFYSGQIAFAKFVWWLWTLIFKWSAYLKLFWDNAKILVENMWIIWDNLPFYIKSSLNSGLKVIENFLNSASNWVNNFAKRLWYEGELVWKVSLSWLDTTQNKVWQTKDFKTAIDETWTNDFVNTVQKEIDIIEEKKKAHKEATMSIMQDIINEAEKKTAYDTKMNFSDSKIETEKQKVTWSNKKDKEEQIKAELEQQKRLADYKKTVHDNEQKRLKERLDKVWETYKWATKIIKDQTDEAKSKIEELIKSIDDLNEANNKLSEDKTNLESKKITNLGDRYNEIIKQEASLKKDLWWDIDGEKKLETEKELNNLLKEKSLITANLDEKQIAEAQRQDSLNPTEKYLEEYNLELKKIEDQKLLNEAKILELQTQKQKEENILKLFDEKQKTLDETYKNKKLEIETQITDNLAVEAEKRIGILKTVELQALATAEALRNAWNQTATNTNNSQTSNNSNISNTTSVNVWAINLQSWWVAVWKQTIAWIVEGAQRSNT